LVLFLSALLLALGFSSSALEWLVMTVAVVGSLVVGLLYGLAWGWKGLLMSIAIAFVYTVAGFVGLIFWLQSQPPTAGFLSGIAGVAVVVVGGISFFLALIGGVVGAVLHRRRSRIREFQ